MAGRPTTYTEDIANKICSRLSCGESLRSVCRDEGMPAQSTVFLWLGKHEEFRAKYTIAKEESATAMAEDILDIADDGSNDWMEKLNADGEVSGYALNGEHVNRSRLRVDTRKWLMSKMQPKKYGDKVTTEHEVSDTLKAFLSTIDGKNSGLPGGDS